MKTNWTVCALIAAALCCGQLAAQEAVGEPSAAETEAALKRPNDASHYTRRKNRRVLQELDFNNRQDYFESIKGTKPGWRFDGVIRDEDGKVVWSLKQYDFLNNSLPQGAPPTVNPSLWRQAQLNIIGGLFEVVEGQIYQLRGFDLSNMTLINGEKGWIVIDPLITEQAARYALQFANERLGARDVSAVIFTHSHIDHYGGVLGVTTQDRIRDGNTKIYAPEGFFDAAVNENIIAGNVMARRASYMYGSTLLLKSPRSQVGAGLGKTTSQGQTTTVRPTDKITATIEEPQSIPVDGVDIEFWNTPEAEAPSEMMFYFRDFDALCTSEELTHTLHNLYSLRGAKVRDSLVWSGYLDDALRVYGDSAKVMFASHHWPTWGNESIKELLAKQRDLYKYLHDQTLRLANQGYTMLEIAERVELPKSLGRVWANRDYYGTVNHNVKAVYQRYLGWFDANPANLHSLPPSEAGVKYVEFMGGSDEILRRARESYEKGEYRWVGMVVNHVVFAEPDNQAARDLLADAYEQLGYQAESGPWRNFYLTGARELREPKRVKRLKEVSGDPHPSDEELGKLSPEEYFNYVAIHLNGPKADGKRYAFKLHLLVEDREDEPETGDLLMEVRLDNSVLRAEQITKDNRWSALEIWPKIRMPQSLLNTIMLLGGSAGAARFRIALEQEPESTSIQGTALQKETWYDFLTMLDRFEFWFNIIEP